MKYKTIYCDPPWIMPGGQTKEYKNEKKWKTRSIEYKMMSIEDIKNMKHFISDISEPDCHLYMWVTSNILQEGLDVMKEWGFRYITNLVWNKTSGVGVGYYFRTYHEICLFGSKGKPVHDKHVFIRSVISAPRTGHSRKPQEMYDLIEKRSAGPYIELFARNTHPGWDSWGNETTKFDEDKEE